MRRVDALRTLIEVIGDRLIVCNIGDPSRELFSLCDRPNHFYMLGSMGLASSIGLGVALARPQKEVVAIDGDGAVLMNLGTLATIADRGLDNFLLVIIDNGIYGSTGGQATCTAGPVDLAAMARGAGVKEVSTVKDEDALAATLRTMVSGVLVVKVDRTAVEGPNIELEPRDIADRFTVECRRP